MAPVRCTHSWSERDADLVAAAVEEVIYALDTDGEIPVAVEVARAGDGGIDLALRTVDAGTVEIIGRRAQGGLAVRPGLRTGCVRAVVMRGDRRRLTFHPGPGTAAPTVSL